MDSVRSLIAACPPNIELGSFFFDQMDFPPQQVSLCLFGFSACLLGCLGAAPRQVSLCLTVCLAAAVAAAAAAASITRHF